MELSGNWLSGASAGMGGGDYTKVAGGLRVRIRVRVRVRVRVVAAGAGMEVWCSVEACCHKGQAGFGAYSKP